MKNAQYWIALQNAIGYGSIKISDILEKFENISDLFDKKLSRNDVSFLSAKQYEKIKKTNFKTANEIIDYCDKKDIKIITLDDKEYPIILKRIRSCPAVLYVRGELPNFDEEVGIGMIGTRKCSMNGMIIASTLAYRISQAGAVVISGGANGIDIRCSQGALFAKMPSVIIRPCGLDYNYLNKWNDVYKSVERNGAVISEVQPLGRVEPDAFQIRNRLISALSRGILVVEAPLASGTNITVNYALEYGKDIFAVPGDISNENYAGSNKLLQDGAIPVYSPSDVLNEYIFSFPHKLNLNKAGTSVNEDDIYLRLQKKYSKKTVIDEEEEKPKKVIGLVKKVKRKFEKEENPKVKPKELPFSADENVKAVYDCLPLDSVSADEIIEKSGLDSADVLFALTELEINGVIRQLPGGRFEINNN